MRLLLVLASLGLATAALAYEPTAAEIDACRPEVMRLCFWEAVSGDRARVIYCLHQNRQQLVAPCRHVLAVHRL